MTDRKLAAIIWQASKMLVALLEKEYGFGRKVQQAVETRIEVWRVEHE